MRAQPLNVNVALVGQPLAGRVSTPIDQFAGVREVGRPDFDRARWWHHAHIDGAPEVLDVVGESMLHQHRESVQRHSQRTGGRTIQRA